VEDNTITKFRKPSGQHKHYIQDGGNAISKNAGYVGVFNKCLFELFHELNDMAAP
jgi:hypothetical protein